MLKIYAETQAVYINIEKVKFEEENSASVEIDLSEWSIRELKVLLCGVQYALNNKKEESR